MAESSHSYKFGVGMVIRICSYNDGRMTGGKIGTDMSHNVFMYSQTRSEEISGYLTGNERSNNY